MKVHHILTFLVVSALSGAGCGSSEPNIEAESSAEVLPVVDSVTAENFFKAALEGQTTEVRAMLEQGVSVATRDPDGRTAIMFACFNGHTELVSHLLDAGADVHQVDAMGRTPLLFAATGPFPKTVALLLDRGSEVNQADTGEHFTPLMMAAAEGHLDVVRLLLERGADPNLTDIDGDTARKFALDRGQAHIVSLLPEPME